MAEFFLWAASSPPAKKNISKAKRGIKYFTDLGWKLKNQTLFDRVVKSSSSSAKLNFLALKEKQSIAELKKISRGEFRKRKVFCLRGGYGNLRLIDLLDEAELEKKKKLEIWGYSDTTILQHEFFIRYGWPWVHSPMLAGLKQDLPKKMQSKWPKAGGEKEFQFDLKLLYNTRHETIPQSALLLGGNLVSLVSWLACRPKVKLSKEYFLFLEDIQESGYQIDRALVQLRSHPFFKNCRGIILGHFTNCPQYEEVLENFAKEENKLLLSKLPVGHEDPNLPIAMGRKVDLKKVTSKKFSLKVPNPLYE